MRPVVLYSCAPFTAVLVGQTPGLLQCSGSLGWCLTRAKHRDTEFVHNPLPVKPHSRPLQHSTSQREQEIENMVTGFSRVHWIQCFTSKKRQPSPKIRELPTYHQKAPEHLTFLWSNLNLPCYIKEERASCLSSVSRSPGIAQYSLFILDMLNLQKVKE